MKKKIILSFILLLLATGAFLGWKLFGSSVSTSGGEFFYIKTGSGYADVKNELIDKKYIKNSRWFDLASKILRFKNVKPGRYKITSGMSIWKLVRMLRAGNQKPVSFVITKIRTKEDFARKTGKIFETDSLQMIGFLNNMDTLSDYGLDTNNVTAVMLPLTYTLNWNSTPEKIFESCFSAYKKFWTKERIVKADSLHLNRIEITTLASIIEEETLKKDDKPNIASVYLNRIRIGMPLQADPTVKFAMKDFTLKRILNTHLKTVSPYNTYLNRGLPPGPICTPSAETIDAVLNAPKTEYLYFVASDKFDGSSVFTTNLTDHSKYAKLYQQELTRRMDSAKKANENK
ncbi:MAG: endolytic transglycosylase MltG [Sphingobacteriales bacterium]|nr:endolytic transglycosylase MltG [Sphingobacteriales bacterium]